MLGRNRVGQDGFYARRRGLRGRMGDWTRRHPFIAMFTGVVALGWITWAEAARIESARYTVAQGWGTGLATGILASLGLTALWVVMLLATRDRPGLRGRAQAPLALILVASWATCLRATMAHNSPHGDPYVVTTGIDVGMSAYTATYSAYFIVLIIWGAARLWRRARLH